MSYVGNTPTTQAFTPAIDYFSGNGSTVAFTLSRPVASVAQVEVTVNNVPQNPGSAFTVSGQTLTFTGTPSTGTNNIYVYYTSPITQVIQPGQGTVNTLQLVDASVTTAKLSSTTGTGAVALASLPSFTTTIGVGGATASASGSGITFPATQSASSNANTLDDYEEGTFTPAFASTGTQPSVTPYNTNGVYIKIGSMVYVSMHVQVSAVASVGTGVLYIANLPFTASNPAGNAGYQALSVGYSANFGLSQGPVGALVFQNTQVCYIYYLATLVGNKIDITSASLTANTEIYVAGCYQVAS